MSVEAIMAANALQSIQPEAVDAGMSTVQGAGQVASATPVDQFGQLVSHGLESVNNELLVSQTDLQQLAVGNAQNLHQIMMRLEESRLSFGMLMQVRNRLLEAYQDVMKMQV